MSRILVIEDEPQVIDTIIDILELEDHETFTADNGLQGVKTALEIKPDLIICDVMMPKMSGYDVLRVLRSESDTAATPFIFLTAKADRADLRYGMELGADDYLTKPFTPRELLQAIATRFARQGAVEKEYDHQLQAMASQLQSQLYIDPITDLPNRLTLGEQFNQAVKRYRPDEEPPKLLCITDIQIDRFATIRHNLDYQNTDELLQAFAQRLKANFRDDFIAHVSDAEFVIIFRPVRHKRELTDPIDDLLRDLATPFMIQEQKIFLSVSAGMTLYSRDGRSIGALLHNAQTAIEELEKQGGNGHQFFSSVMNVGKAPSFYLEAELRDAIAEQQLQVHYQPKVNLATQRIESCEALIRWQHPQEGLISPGRFLPMAEEVGLIDKIGEYVLERASKQVQEWNQQFQPPLSVAVNVSSRQFNRVDLRQRVLQALVDYGLAPEYLELELTESSLVQDFVVAKRRLDAFRHLGVSIAIDDFGTGYSSLKYLQQFNFDTLKIDRCFIHNIHQNVGNAAITKATIEMAHNLGLKVVAEGVEIREELEWLKAHNCDLIQGYYFSRPLTAEDFTALLRSDRASV